jgi:prepilin-type N-terminal cleavage/methylation domain-containing protein
MVGLSNAHLSSRMTRRPARGGFSLIELVIVVVIIGIIAAIAIPRMSRGSQGAADSALAGNLSVLRNAVDLYQTEHQAYPAAGVAEDQAVFERQLTRYTDASGGGTATQAKTSTHVYGPYLRKIPPLPVGSKKGQATLKVAAAESELPGLSTHAWIYYPTTGEIKANLLDTEVDSKGTVYNQY